MWSIGRLQREETAAPADHASEVPRPFDYKLWMCSRSSKKWLRLTFLQLTFGS